MTQPFVKKAYHLIRKPLKGLYNRLPDSKRLGSSFNRTYDFLEESQWWSRQQHETRQLQQTKDLIEHACRNVPYYRRLFNEVGMTADSITSLNDLKRLPFLTRDIIQEHLKDLVAANYKRTEIVAVTTGGSTSVPLGFYEERRLAETRQMAFVAHQWSRVGYDRDKRNRIVILRGTPIQGIYERNGNHLILSSYQMTNDNKAEYIERINRFDPHFLHVYPSTISLLADFVLDNGIRPDTPSLKAILSSSEKIVDYQKEKIEKAFGVRLLDLYGHAEHSCMAAECEKSRLYHLVEEYGYTELIGKNGEAVAKDREIGEIVCTGFNNYVMPFIRYRTGDMAVYTTESCSCGRNYRLLKRIEGRVQEFFIDREGTAITFTCSDDALWGVKDRIWAYQYVQDIPGKVVLKILPKDEFTRNDISRVSSEFYKFYPALEIDVVMVDNIERTARGKFKYLIQNIRT